MKVLRFTHNFDLLSGNVKLYHNNFNKIMYCVGVGGGLWIFIKRVGWFAVRTVYVSKGNSADSHM